MILDDYTTPDKMGENFALDTAHNFGIYTKSGKRTIFQIDFSCKRINLIERGKINKSFDFISLEQYDSEENLHIVLRFRSNKSLDFDADTAEEKYTICRLLSIIIGAEQVENLVYDGGENGVRHRLNTKKQVLKEGVLDKKGNTKIPTWSRRKIQVCPGEFSYYKPGEEVALNLVQLWENITSVNRTGSNGFTVAVRDRAYHFRVMNEKGVNVESERNSWIEAFKQASQRKRATFLLLEMAKKTNYDGGRHGMALPPPPAHDFEDPTYYNQNTSRGSSSGSEGSGRELMEGLETVTETETETGPDAKTGPHTAAINELDEVLEDETFRPRSIALSVVKKTGPMLASPTKTRARPPALGGSGKGGSFTSSTDNNAIYDFIPEPDYSPPSSPVREEAPSGFPSSSKDRDNSGIYKKVITTGEAARASGIYATEIPYAQISRDKQTSGKYKNVITANETDAGVGNRLSGQARQSGMYTKFIAQAPAGAVDVMPKFDEIPKLRKVNSEETAEESEPKSSSNEGEPTVYENTKVDVRKFKENIENTYANDQSNKVSPREKRFPAPGPSKQRRAPSPPTQPAPAPPSPPTLRRPPDIPIPPPPAVPVPPPPLIMNGGGPKGRGKLKQVHWSRTPKPLVANSIWERPVDKTHCLNLRLLEEQFAVKDIETPTTQGPKVPGGKSQLLIDGKRAQNLGIFMAGMKNEGTRRLVDILNCVTEDDSFPAEKLTTIRRLQPTEDEIDMYRAYTNKRHELHPVDKFMLELCEIPHLSLRIDICLTLWDFPWQYDSTCQLVEQVHGACDELLDSQMLVAVLEYILAIGNHLNRNWSDDNVTNGFQVTSMDKILDVRGKESGYNLTHFLVDQLRTSDPGLLQWPDTVQSVKKCEQVSPKSVSAESDVLRGDLVKIRRHLKTLKTKNVKCTRQDNKFQQDVQNLVVEYELKLEKLDRRCAELHSKYRKVLMRFGEPMYQKSDQLFAVISNFSDRFKTAITDLESRKARKNSSS